MSRKSYFDSLIGNIVRGDCLKILSKIPADSIDVAFADPPFNLKKKYGSYRDKQEEKDYLKWCRKWLHEMVRVTKPTGSIFVHNIPKWLIHYGSFLNEKATFRHWIAWDAMGIPLGKTLLPNHYGILYYIKSAKEFKFHSIRMLHKRCRVCGYILKDYGGKKDQMHQFGPVVSDVWVDIHRIRHKARRDEHPCQLPIHLLERLLLMSSDENDIVLDPFVGTGTTVIAAKKLGRRFIGIDVDPKYVQITKAKLKETEPSMLADAYVSNFLGKVITVRDKDWPKIKDRFVIPGNPLELEKMEIRLPNWKANGNGKMQFEILPKLRRKKLIIIPPQLPIVFKQ